MASLFKPTYTKVNPRTRQKETRRSRKWYVKYRDADGIIRKVPGYTDKEATRQLAAELERQAARRHAGMTDPFELHRKRPLAGHLEDYAAHLSAKNDTDKHVKLTISRIRAILDG